MKQTVALPAGYHLRRNGLVQYAVLYRAMDTLAVENAKITATLIYANGTPSQKIVLNLTGRPAEDYEVYAGMAYLTDGSLSRIKLKINHKSTAGVLLVDLRDVLCRQQLTRRAGRRAVCAAGSSTLHHGPR